MLRRALLLTVFAIVALSASPAYAKSCALSNAEEGGSNPSTLGGTYVRNLTAKGTSCGKAKKIVKGFNACRGTGKSCGSKVSGYTCKSKNVVSSPLQFDADASCKKSGSKVTWGYTQNT